MILLHGTSKANSDIIINEGLKPRTGNSKGNWFRDCHIPSINNFVYLTAKKEYAEFHAARTSMISNSDCCILSIKVVEENLWPDENLFAENRILNKNDVKEYQFKVLKNKNKWKESIDKVSAVAHEGGIDSSSIIKYDTFSIEDSAFYSFVRDMKNKDIDSFDISFNVYLKLAHSGWFYDKVSTIDNVDSVMRDFKIYNTGPSLYCVEFRGHKKEVHMETGND